jgi:hypothetical protein
LNLIVLTGKENLENELQRLLELVSESGQVLVDLQNRLLEQLGSYGGNFLEGATLISIFANT